MGNHFFNTNTVICFVAMTFLTLSCNDKKQNSSKQDNLPETESFVVADSIVLSEPLMFLKDKKGSEMIFVRHTNQDILLYNETTKTSRKTNKFGQDPYSVRTPVNENIGFFSNNIFWISDIGNIKKFNLQGDFVEQIDIESVNEYAPLKNIFFGDGYILALEVPVGFTNEYAYYTNKRKIFVKYDIKVKTQEKFFDFPPEDSHFFTEDYYLANNSYFFTNLIDENVLTYLYAVEPIIYKIDINSLEIVKKISFNPEYFSPLKAYFKDKPDNNRIFMQAYMGSVFTSHFIVDYINYAFYSIPYSEEFMVEFVKTHKNFPFEEAPDIKFALTIFDNDGKKLRDDIVFPSSLGKPLLMDEQGIIYFMKNPTEYDEKKGQTVYYKVRLTDAKP